MFPPLLNTIDLFWCVFFKHTLGLRRLRTESCNHIVHYITGHPIETAKRTDIPLFFGVRLLTCQAVRGNLLYQHCQPKGSRFCNGNYPLPGQRQLKLAFFRKRTEFFLTRNNSICICSLPPLHIYWHANKPHCHSETTSSALLKPAALDAAGRHMATGACASWIRSSDIWSSSADFTTPFFSDTSSLPITRVFKQTTNNVGRKLL